MGKKVLIKITKKLPVKEPTKKEFFERIKEINKQPKKPSKRYT